MVRRAGRHPAPRLPGPGEPPVPPWPGATVVVDGHALYVRRAGDASLPPGVFVHGLGGNSTNWTDLMALLADRLDGHAPDLPGFGRSGPPRTGRYPLDLHVDAIARYAERLDRGPVHLFGNSLGGAVCTRLAARRPDLVATLTLISPALPRYDVRGAVDPRLGLLLLPGAAAVAVRHRDRMTPEDLAQDVLEYCVADPGALRQERLADLAAEVRRRRALPWATPALVGSLRGLVRAYLDPGPANLWRQAARVAAPTLVVAGRLDRVVPCRVAEHAGRVFPDVRLVLIDDAAHVAQIERPEVVAALVRAHLDGYADPGVRSAGAAG